MEIDKPKLNKKEEKLYKKIQSEISYCSYDQSYDEGEIVWLWGDKTNMYDLLSNYDVSENSQNKILSHLSCPACGFSDFDISTLIGTKSNYDIELENLYKKAKKKYFQAINNLEKDIITTPHLALNNPLARKIFRELKKKTWKTTEASGVFYRARKANAIPFTVEEMSIPDLGIPAEGRYNHNGQPHFYLSENKVTAEAEVLQGSNLSTEIYVQKFVIKIPFSNILDLSHELYEIDLKTIPFLVALFSFVEKKGNNKSNFKPDYYLPRFIADCAKSVGYDGIKYTSSLNHNGFNIVLFSNFENIVPEGTPELIKTQDYSAYSDDLDY